MEVLLFFVGGSIGSFFNLCTKRFVEKESVIFGRSHCDRCANPLSWYELVPAISYLCLRGRCGSCGHRIDLGTFLDELFLGILVVVLYLRNLRYELIVLLVLLYLLARIDWLYYIVPDYFQYVILFLAVVKHLSVGGDKEWLAGILGMFVISVPLYFSLYLMDGGIGGGDIKLFATLGFYFGTEQILSIWIWSLILGVLGAVFFFRGKKVPFVPFISLAVGIEVLLK